MATNEPLSTDERLFFGNPDRRQLIFAHIGEDVTVTIDDPLTAVQFYLTKQEIEQLLRWLCD